MTMRRTHRRGSSGRRTSRRITTWENLAIEFTLASGANAITADLTPEPMGEALVGTATIVRSILTFNHQLLQTNAANQHVAVGITVMTNDAFTAGATPDPAGDFQQDWYYWHIMNSVRVSGGAPENNRWEADIRSARRLRGGFKLVMVVQTLSAEHPTNSSMWATLRNLWQIT